jgi:predicted porin
VNIYGTVVINYNIVDPGAGKPTVDMFNAHDANIGFRGEEKLGRGLSAWFQCESSLDATGEEASFNGLCARNSGLGFKGAFGNIFWGQWDTPAKMAAAPARIWSTSGVYGNAEILWNGSASNAGNGVRAAPLSAASTALNAAGFSRRQFNTWNYHSPSWGGFVVRGQFSATDEATGVTDLTTANKSRMYSLGASYTNGPLYVGVGYDRHKDFNPASQGTYIGGDDRLWNLVAAYTFARVFKLTGLYTDINYELAGSTNAKRKSWAIYGDWNISGPHVLRAGYAKANDTKGSAGVIGAPAAGVSINAMFANAGQGGTGADLIGIQYAYLFSKRTEINFGYSRVDNDQFARYALQTSVRPGTVGQKSDSFTLGVRTRF